MADESRIEKELAGDEYSYKSRIEQFIAWLNEDIPTHPEPKSRIEEQLAAMTPGGGGSATLIEKTATENGVYNASDDSADGYSKFTVAVPTDDAYFGIPVAKTFADTHNLEHKIFSTTEYDRLEVLPSMFLYSSSVFDYDSVTTTSNTEARLYFGNVQAKTSPYQEVDPSWTLGTYGGNFSDTFRVNISSSTDWDAEMVANSNAVLMMAPRADGYMSMSFGRAGANKCAWWSCYYQGEFRTVKSFGETPGHYTDLTINTRGNYMVLAPLMDNSGTSIVDGLYQVLYGDPQLCGFYEVGGQLFYISAGIAIKDE